MRWLAALGVAALAGTAMAGKPVRSVEADGQHIRIETDHGAVHVWTPPGYRSETAGIALYVHGYYTDVDKAWKAHRLAQKFRGSGRNALFIVPEAPDGIAQPVFWPDLGDLLVEVQRQTGLRRPWGPVVAMVHSGGYRTAVKWLEDDSLEQLILLDAMYGEEETFRAWIEAPDTSRQLFVVGADTLRWTEAFAHETTEDGISTAVAPYAWHRFDEWNRRARVVYMRSGLGHMDLVEGSGIIPALYRMTRLPAAAGAR